MYLWIMCRISRERFVEFATTEKMLNKEDLDEVGPRIALRFLDHSSIATPTRCTLLRTENSVGELRPAVRGTGQAYLLHKLPGSLWCVRKISLCCAGNILGLFLVTSHTRSLWYQSGECSS